MKKTSQYRRGFTIVEVVLFLAITGLMLAGILVAVGAGVNGKRYTEAVDSFHNFLISQFDQADNVANTANEAGSTGSAVQCNADSPKPAGTTSCSIVGRLVTSSDGLKIQATPLYAGNDVTEIDSEVADTPAEMLTALGLYTISGSPDSQVYDMRWQTNLRSEDGTGIQPFTMMIVRLPYSKGSISYISDSSTYNIGGLIPVVTASSALDSQLVLCVDPAGLQTAPPVGIVVENAGSGGASSIQREGSLCR